MFTHLMPVQLLSAALLAGLGTLTQTWADPPEIDTVPTTVFKDAITGVAFRYPSVWQVLSPSLQNGYLPAAIMDTKQFQPKLNVVFSPTGNLYEKTNLQDLSFTYGVAHVAGAEACRDLVAKNTELTAKAHTVTNLNGIAFTEGSGSDGAMSHQLNFTLDSTWQRGTCFVFERDEATIAPGVQEGKRTLRSSEQAALQRHLDSVFQSLTLSSSGAK